MSKDVSTAVRVYQGNKLRHVSPTCKVYRTPNGTRLEFCQANMTVDLPPAVTAQIAYLERNA